MTKTVDDLTMQLAKAGQPFASVFARSRSRAAGAGQGQGCVNLVYTIDEGKRLYVERIEIHGNTKTRDDVIRREFDFGEGDAYNRALVDRAERHLKALGYFKSVKIHARSRARRRTASCSMSRSRSKAPAISRFPAAIPPPPGWLAEVSVSDTNLLGTGDMGKASVTYGQYARGFDLGFTDPLCARPAAVARRRSVRQRNLRQHQSVLRHAPSMAPSCRSARR